MAALDEGVTGIILGADTIVVIDQDVLNKPRDPAEARVMLRRLAGRIHRVYTGAVVLASDAQAPSSLQLALDASDVQMAPLSDSEIADYVATGEPLDKAGAYGIQGLGGRLVQHVQGSYTCVVGLPLVTTHRVLTAMGLIGLADPIVAFERWLADQGRTPPACTAP
jgi:septum formation protein